MFFLNVDEIYTHIKWYWMLTLQFHSFHNFSIWLCRIANAFIQSESTNINTERHQKYYIKTKELLCVFDAICDVFTCIDIYAFTVHKNIRESMQPSRKTAQTTKVHYVGIQHSS